MKRLVTLLVVVSLTSGCGEDFAPETLLTGLRVLGMKAEPASLRPGETASLSALVLDPTRPGKPNSILWVGCDPDPLNLGRTACSNATQLSDPSALAGDNNALPEGMRIIGFNGQAGYRAPPNLWEALPADDRRRRVGTVGQLLAITIGAEVNPGASQEELQSLFEKVRNKEIASLVVLFRIQVSELPESNTNPTISGLKVNGEPLPEGWTLRVKPEEKLNLELEAPDEAFEKFLLVLPESEEEQTERLIGAWYSTTGRFKETRLALRSETPQIFTAPGDEKNPIPESRSGTLYTVVRDTRGGQSWREFPLYVCDEAMSAPSALELQPSTGPADGSQILSLRGAHLDSTLEVIVGNKPLQKGVFSAVSGTFEGFVPPLPPGDHPVMLRGKHCADVPTGLNYRVP